MKKTLCWVATFVIALSGCSKPNADEMLAKAKESYEHARATADTMGRQADNAKLFGEPMELFSELGAEYPGTPQGGEALFMLATIRNNHTREYLKAIEAYRQYVDTYPQGERSPMALFLMGYLYNNELLEFDSAAAVYRRFLERFPNHELALSAQFELQTLGKPPAELLPPEPAVAASSAKERPAGKRSSK
jgi:outer membrane protein assembly factor BamD (BamD/ComL family)